MPAALPRSNAAPPDSRPTRAASPASSRETRLQDGGDDAMVTAPRVTIGWSSDLKLLRRRRTRSDPGPHFSHWMTRPYSAGELHPVAEGFEVGPPDFVGIGAGSSGSSWWYGLLLNHPQIEPNRLARKELQYFYHFRMRPPSDADITLYHSAFARPPGHLCGEWSPGYLTFPLALDHLAAAAPHTKLMAILRNPIDRYRSALARLLRRRAAFLGLEGTRRYVLETFSLYPEAIRNGLYADGLLRAAQLFGRERLLVLQYEQCVADPAGAFRRTSAFLGIEAQQPRGLERRPRSATSESPELSALDRSRLAGHFASDVDRLVHAFPEIQRRWWPDFDPGHALPDRP